MPHPLTVLDTEGQTARLAAQPTDPLPPRVDVQMDDGTVVSVPSDLLEEQSDGGYRLRVALSQLDADGTVRLTEAEEQLHVEKRVRATSRVQIRKRVQEHEEVVDEPLVREDVEVERVEVGQYVDEVPTTRTEGDVTIIPIVEEVLVVERRLRLKEEVRVTKRRTEHHHTERVTLRQERVEVDSVEPNPGSTGALGRDARSGDTPFDGPS